MIRSHRRRHLRIFASLAVLLPLVLLAALASKQNAPVVGSAPAVLDHPRVDDWAATDSVEARVSGVGIRLRLLKSVATPTRFGVELLPAPALRAPDVAVYWTAAVDATNARLPGDAVFLGSLAGARPRRLALPQHGADGHTGSLVLYSVAHRTVLGTIVLRRRGDE